MSSTAYAWAPITKVEENEDGTVLVHGPVSDGGLDRDRQRMDQAWLDKAMPKWMAEAANVREQHLSTRAVGVGVGLSRRDDGVHDLTALVVDPVAVKKVQTGVLKGFSIGIREPRLDLGKADAPNGVIVGGDIIEVSLVDRPANPRTMFTMAKADGGGDLEGVEDPEVEELEDDDKPTEEATEEADETEAEEAQEDEVTKAEIVDELVTVLGLTKAEDVVAAVKDLVKPEAPAAEEPEAEPDEMKADETKADAPDLSKAEVAYLTKADADAMLIEAVAEAIKPLEDRLAKAEAEAVLVKADLAKALEQPVGGGPVATRTAQQTQAARAKDAAALRANQYLAKADATNDPKLKAGYRDLAEQEAKAEGGR